MKNVQFDFCCKCHKWISANEGTMRPKPGGGAEIICDTCLALERHDACSIGADKRSGTLGDGFEKQGNTIPI